MAIVEIMPINPPMTSSQADVESPLGSRQLRQMPPAGAWLLLFWTFSVVDRVLDAEGLSEYVAMKLTVNDWPAWFWEGVNVKAPDAESKAMFGANPVAVRVTGSPGTRGSVAVIVKARVLPTVAVWEPGVARVGGVLGSTTVNTTSP